MDILVCEGATTYISMASVDFGNHNQGFQIKAGCTLHAVASSCMLQSDALTCLTLVVLAAALHVEGDAVVIITVVNIVVVHVVAIAVVAAFVVFVIIIVVFVIIIAVIAAAAAVAVVDHTVC